MRPQHEKMAKEFFGWSGDPKDCVTCDGRIGEFRDALSQREYEISGMCQDCQDKTFGTGE